MQTTAAQLVLLAMLSQSADSFSTMPAPTRLTSSTFGGVQQPQLLLRQSSLSSSSSLSLSTKLFASSQDADNEIERLRTMAANLRAETLV